VALDLQRLHLVSLLVTDWPGEDTVADACRETKFGPVGIR
jgi:hypothetical protein